MMNLLVAALIFTLCLVNDLLAVLFVRRVSQGKAMQASLCAMGIECVAFVTVLAWVQSPWFLLPTCGGVFAGTFLMVRHENKKVTC